MHIKLKNKQANVGELRPWNALRMTTVYVNLIRAIIIIIINTSKIKCVKYLHADQSNLHKQ